jgi:hypothetical protein
MLGNAFKGMTFIFDLSPQSDFYVRIVKRETTTAISVYSTRTSKSISIWKLNILFTKFGH